MSTMDDLPFADCDQDVVPYGSLHKVAPYVSTPVAALVRAVELAALTMPSPCHDQQLDDVVELGCGQGEFLRQIHAAGWLDRNSSLRRVRRCRGYDILIKELDVARKWAQLALLDDERQCEEGCAMLPALPIEFVHADIFQDESWSDDASLVFICLVPRMLSQLEEKFAKCCSKKGFRVITYCYHFAEDSTIHNDYLHFSDDLLNLRLYCSRKDTAQVRV